MAIDALDSYDCSCTLLSWKATKRCSRNLVKEEEKKKRVQLLESHELFKVSHYATDLTIISLLHMKSSCEDDA